MLTPADLMSLKLRLKHGVKLTDYDRSTFFDRKTAKGYSDYPFALELLGKQ